MAIGIFDKWQVLKKIKCQQSMLFDPAIVKYIWTMVGLNSLNFYHSMFYSQWHLPKMLIAMASRFHDKHANLFCNGTV
jgi:hypothetical protein